MSICCYFVAYKSTYVLYPYLLLLLLLSVDQVITSKVPLLGNQTFNTAYSKTTAFGNLLTRGFQSATPFSAAVMLSETANRSWFFSLAFSMLYGFAYPHIRFRHSTIHTEPRDDTNETIREEKLHFPGSKAWGCWFLCFNVLVNLSQGAVAFVLISVDPNVYGPIYSSLLYGGFLIIQILVVSGLIDFTKISARPSAVVILLFINAFELTLLAVTTHVLIIAAVASLVGLVYGLSVPFLSEVILPRLRGPGFPRTSGERQKRGSRGFDRSFMACRRGII